jgi:hypothetical protein
MINPVGAALLTPRLPVRQLALCSESHRIISLQSPPKPPAQSNQGIVFCETGLVLTPFLPGDSLLFAAGAFAGMGQLDVGLLFAVFMTSAVLGDAVNYAIGARLGGCGSWLGRRPEESEPAVKTPAPVASSGQSCHLSLQAPNWMQL